jgi:8-oxo-dGTP diphosphatase
MRLLMESWNSYLQEDEDMNRVSKAIMIGDIEEFNDGKVLILKRAQSHITEDSPWEWDLPGGHLRKGEGEKEGLVRELAEETGLSPLHVPNWFLLTGHTRFFIIQDWKGTFKLSDEHQDYEWIDLSETTNFSLGKMYIHAIQQAFKDE